MAMIKWGDPYDKTYQSGIDRGVVYNNDGTLAQPWNGLISVENKPNGGDVESAYLDGIRRLSVPSPTYYSATITAFSVPPIVEQATGVTPLYAPGLYNDNGIQKTFNMTYRSFIGNECNPEDGYKIHFLYGLVITKPTISDKTRSDSSELDGISYDVVSNPTNLNSLRVNHLYIDTRDVKQKARIASIEDLIYGTVTTAPSMPIPSTLSLVLLS